jgi:retinaldehyde-binding protein 1
MAEFRKEHAKVLDGLMPEQEKVPFTESNMVNVLTNKDHKNRRVLVVNNGGNWDPSVVSSDSLFRMFYLSECHPTSLIVLIGL